MNALTNPAAEKRTLRILLAEDNKLAAQTLTSFLGLCGHVVTHAANGKIALEEFERDPEEWDLLITDLIMPELMGFDLIRAVREQRPGLLVIVTSGYLSDREMDRLYDLEIEHILAKPIQPDALEVIIERTRPGQSR